MNALVPVTIQPDDLEVVQRTARLLAVSGYFDAKGDTPTAIAQVATKILAGRELGFGPFAAVNGIYIIQGRPAVGANLMAAAVKGSGRYDYRVKTMTDTECSIEFFAVANGHRESLGVSTFTAKDAKAAGTKNLDKFPRNMLFARAMSNGVRWYCPDVFSGNAVYVPEELGADVDGDGNVVNGSVRTVDAATGEILPATPPTPRSAPPQPPQADVDGDVLFGTDDTEPPTDEEHAIIESWAGQKIGVWHSWAVSQGANEFESKNRLKKIVDAHGGWANGQNAAAIALAFIRRTREQHATAQAA